MRREIGQWYLTAPDVYGSISKRGIESRTKTAAKVRPKSINQDLISMYQASLLFLVKLHINRIPGAEVRQN